MISNISFSHPLSCINSKNVRKKFNFTHKDIKCEDQGGKEEHGDINAWHRTDEPKDI